MAIRRLPPMRAIEAFVRIVRLGSARAAADELGLSPSALSRRVAALEEFIGKRLFTRQHQAMRLTDDGQAFYNAVGPKFDELATAVEGQIENSKVLRLHLGMLPLFGSQRLFPRLPELRKQHPRLHIDFDTSPQLENRVGDTLDAAIVLSKRPDPAFHAVRLDHNRVYAFTSKALGMENLEPAAIDHYDSGQLILEAAANGLGIAIMHDDHFNRSHDTRLAKLFDIEVESPYSYWFICRPHALEVRAVRIFHDWLVKAGL